MRNKYIKYPRTYHLPWSLGLTKDDRVMSSLDNFIGKRVIVTVKCDGECSSLYKDYLHARSIDYSPHPSRNLLKSLHAQIQGDIPEGWRICGENLYAKHSIHYKNLPSYFLVFSIWNNLTCLSWDETLEWIKLLDLKCVPVLYDGIWDEKLIKNLHTPCYDSDECEGYVVRVAESFYYRDFNRCVGKFVRENHVQTQSHWLQQKMEINGVKG